LSHPPLAQFSEFGNCGLQDPINRVFFMPQDQYVKGLANIRSEIDKALQDSRVSAAVIDLAEDTAEPRTATISITADGKREAHTFTYSEIEDSGEAIDAPAAIKVRMLVSHFVR
jgi:hypothetical protein